MNRRLREGIIWTMFIGGSGAGAGMAAHGEHQIKAHRHAETIKEYKAMVKQHPDSAAMKSALAAEKSEMQDEYTETRLGLSLCAAAVTGAALRLFRPYPRDPDEEQGRQR
jgi:hypothetical protein